MGKVLLRSRESLPPLRGAAAGDEWPDPAVETRVALGEANPLAARWHAVPCGAGIAWRESARGHAIYVWSGEVIAGGLLLDAGSCVIVEHGASVDLRAGADGAELLVFNATAACATAPQGEGGHVHLLPSADVPRVERLSGSAVAGGALFADSRCPTCALWLHESTFPEPHRGAAVHSHTEDEVIVVIGGEMVLGGKARGRGTVLFVARDTRYAFDTGEAGLSFINFRPGHPHVRRATDPAPVDETQFYVGLPPLRYRDAGRG